MTSIKDSPETADSDELLSLDLDEIIMEDSEHESELLEKHFGQSKTASRFKIKRLQNQITELKGIQMMIDNMQTADKMLQSLYN